MFERFSLHHRSIYRIFCPAALFLGFDVSAKEHLKLCLRQKTENSAITFRQVSINGQLRSDTGTLVFNVYLDYRLHVMFMIWLTMPEQ